MINRILKSKLANFSTYLIFIDFKRQKSFGAFSFLVSTYNLLLEGTLMSLVDSCIIVKRILVRLAYRELTNIRLCVINKNNLLRCFTTVVMWTSIGNYLVCQLFLLKIYLLVIIRHKRRGLILGDSKVF